MFRIPRRGSEQEIQGYVIARAQPVAIQFFAFLFAKQKLDCHGLRSRNDVPLNFVLVMVFLIITCLISLPTYALDSDHKEKLNIIADSGQYNFKTGVDVYEGHVKLDQGTTHVTADKLITKKNKKHKITEAIAYGETELAHYWTLPKQGDPDMHARAKIIKFYPLQMNVTLEKEVHITQGENNFKGELIHYNSKDQVITMPASTNGRAMPVFNPINKYAQYLAQNI